MLIGVIGNKRVGKTTFADYIVEKYGFITFAFADPIKEGAKIMFDLSEEQVNGNLKEVLDKRWGFTPRQFLQILGTDCCREKFGKDVWIKRMKFWYEKNKTKNVVISDIRFPNEAEAVKEMGGILIKITNSNIIPKKDLHISEQLIDKINYDVLIENNGTITEYFGKIEKKLILLFDKKNN